MQSEINIPKELHEEIEDYSKAEGMNVKEFILWALGEKVGELRERLGVKNLSRINFNLHSEQPVPNKIYQQLTNPPILLKAIDVSKYLKISRSATYKLMKSGTIPVVKIGKNIRVREEDLEIFILDAKTVIS